MPLEKTEAVLLKAFNWSESSRTVVFFSRNLGRLALIDKGGRSLKSKRGRILPFHRLEMTYYTSRQGGRGYVADCEVVQSFTFDSEGELGRLAYGSAACELLYLLLPEEEGQPDLYTYFLTYLSYLSHCDRQGLPALFINFFLRLLSLLGYHPSLAYCTSCERPVSDRLGDSSGVFFSPGRGGIVCSTCQKAGEQYIGLSRRGFDQLVALQTAALSEAAGITVRYEDAVILIDAVTRFLKFHADTGADLKSLTFLEKLKQAHL